MTGYLGNMMLGADSVRLVLWRHRRRDPERPTWPRLRRHETGDEALESSCAAGLPPVGSTRRNTHGACPSSAGT